MDRSKRNQASKTERRGGSMDGKAGAPLSEWVIGVVAALLVLGMVGYILYEALSATESTPELAISVSDVEEIAGRYTVRFRAINTGDAAAAAVQVEGHLGFGGETVETSEVTLDYVPAHSEREGALLFTRDPAGYELELEPRGYQMP